MKEAPRRLDAFHGKLTVFVQDFTENEDPEEKARRHKEQEVSSWF